MAIYDNIADLEIHSVSSDSTSAVHGVMSEMADLKETGRGVLDAEVTTLQFAETVETDKELFGNGASFSMTRILKAAALYDFQYGAGDEQLREELGLKTFTRQDGTLEVQKPIVAGTASRISEGRLLDDLGGKQPAKSERGSSTMSTASETGTNEDTDFDSVDDEDSGFHTVQTERSNTETQLTNMGALGMLTSSSINYPEERDYSNDVRFLALLDALVPTYKAD